MSDSDIPSRFGPAVKWVTAGIFLFVFVLGASDTFREGKLVQGFIYSGLFLATFIIAVKWSRLAHFFGTRKVTMFYLGLALVSALGLGLALGKLMGRTDFPGDSAKEVDTGRITWNFDQIADGKANLLSLLRLNQDEIRVAGVGIHGKNTSNDPISGLTGYVRSDLTNATMPFFIMADEPANMTAPPNPFFPQQIPTRLEETFGIPGSADFDLVTYEDAVLQQGISGVPLSQFVREFGAFTVILQYDGIKVEHHFKADQVQAIIKKFEKDINPERVTAPRVTRRQNATPPKQEMLPLALPQPNHDQPKGK